MTKAEAATFLGISERMVTTHAGNGRLGAVQYIKGKTRPVVDYDADAVARLKEELETGIRNEEPGIENEGEHNAESEGSALVTAPAFPITTHRSRIIENREASAVVPDARLPGVEVLVDLVAASVVKAIGQGSSLQELAVKLNLTAKEAAHYSGRSEKEIRDAIKSGTLQAVKLSRGAVGVKRSELEKWNG